MDKQKLFSLVEENKAAMEEMAMDLWNHPELSHEEFRSSKLQKDYLKEQGFTIREIPNNPTSFVAEFGSGRPIIGVTGEYDALPKMSQKVCSHREPAKTADTPGHACGHNLLGTGGVGAVVAIKKVMEAENLQGTVRYYGCAAEETLAGKPLIAREGVFDDLDACISWHPSFMNTIWGSSFLAMNSLKFHFQGIPSHAAASPEAGRSALDAVELMDVGANYLREHVRDSVRIHYAITNGGGLPNTVPAEAEVWYYVRAPKRDEVRDTTKCLIKIAQGAALMTETKMEFKLLAGCYDVISNHVLGDLLYKNMELTGGPAFDDRDYAYAREFESQLEPAARQSVLNSYFAPAEVAPMELDQKVIANIDYGKVMAGSTDVGDVSYITPFAQMTAACWPVGISSHTWMSCACTGSSIGMKALLFVSKSLAGTLYDLLTQGEILQAAKDEFARSLNGVKYISPFDE